MVRSDTVFGRAGQFGAGLGLALIAAGAAFLFDPQSGRRRRALIRDQLTSTTHDTRDFFGKVGRDARQRMRGLYESSAALVQVDDANDRILEERVRAALGRLTTRPGAIDVASSDGGFMRLSGDVLAEDLDAVLKGVARVRGVREVANELRVHEDAANIPALQATHPHRPAPRFEFAQQNWSPAPRALAGAVGFGMVVAGIGRATPMGYALAVGGAALLTRSICNKPLTSLLGVRATEADGVLVQKTIQVHAEPHEVYDYWRDLEALPQFMSHVREIRKLDERRYRWVVDGPAGMPVEWEAEIPADVPGELIAWRTLPGSVVHSSGVVQFEPSSYGGTRVHVRMTYRPPANVVGHTIAKVFGRDPKRQIDADMLRFKTFVETGRRASDAAQSGARH